jgi:Flp pilus assembly protein TadD
VRVLPHVVRARCTLSWLAMAKGLSAEAQQFVREYAQAADSAGTENLASRHLRTMVNLTEDAELCWTLGDVLLWLGDDIGADRSFGIAHELRARPRRLETEPERVLQIRRILLEGFGEGALAA